MISKRLVQTAIIGCGAMARYHLRSIVKQTDTTHIACVCEPLVSNYQAAAELFERAGLEPPPNEPDLDRLLAQYAGELDTAFILSPHVYHHDQAKTCLEAGLDVLLEKPMVMNTAEAHSLIEARDRTGRLLVVAFNGSLSPEIRRASSMLRSGELGPIVSISAMVWQNWATVVAGSWRQKFEVSGGGFLFDTGAHMLNTVADLAGEDFVEVAAWLSNRGQPVEVLAVVIGRLRSGALITLHGCGDAIPSCSSDVRVFCTEAILRTGVWGRFLEIQRAGHDEPEIVEFPPSLGVWQRFLDIRDGRIENPCPPEAGLRMARLYDAIRASAALNGMPVRIG